MKKTALALFILFLFIVPSNISAQNIDDIINNYSEKENVKTKVFSNEISKHKWKLLDGKVERMKTLTIPINSEEYGKLASDLENSTLLNDGQEIIMDTVLTEGNNSLMAKIIGEKKNGTISRAVIFTLKAEEKENSLQHSLEITIMRGNIKKFKIDNIEINHKEFLIN